MRTLILIALVSILFISCSKDSLRGNDDIITEKRSVNNFTGVHSSGSNNIHIAYGTEFKVEIRGSSNLIPRYKSKVRNNMLELGYENQVNVHGDDIEVYLTMPLINNVSLSGSGNTDIAGNFPDAESFRLSVSGSADVNVRDTFDCEDVSVSISGSGNANLLKIFTLRADLNISGSGDVEVTVGEHLKARISGSGKVFYAGSPIIDSEISGSGRVQHL
jgi:hypothetical protein